MGSTRIRINAAPSLELYQQRGWSLDEMISHRIRLEQLDEAVAAMNRGEVLRSVMMFES